MRILMANGEIHPASTVFYMIRAFRALGHEVTHDRTDPAGPIDLVVGIDGMDGPAPIPGTPYAYWDTDSFMHEMRVQTEHLFIGGCPEDLAKYPGGTIFLPHAADMELHTPVDVHKEYDIVMVGSTLSHYGERNRLLDMLKERYKVLVTTTAPGLEYSEAMSRGKLIFNRSLGEKNIPMRFFEGMAIGCLITNYNKNLDAYAEKHRHYIPYKTDESLLVNIDLYLNNESKLQAMAVAARQLVAHKHTYQHRALTIINTCLN